MGRSGSERTLRKGQSTTAVPEGPRDASENRFGSGVQSPFHPTSARMARFPRPGRPVAPPSGAASEADRPLVIALLGPTASGKTALAIELAEALDLAVL